MSSLSKNFARNLRDLRAKRGLSLRDLAPLAGITHAHIGLIEHGRRTPSLEVVEKIAKALKVAPTEMLS